MWSCMAELPRALHPRLIHLCAGSRTCRAGILPLFLLLLVWPGTHAVFAAKNAEVDKKTAQLEQVRKRIGTLKSELKDVRGTRDSQQAALEKTDLAISRLTAQLRDTRARVQASEKQLKKLEVAQQAERRKLAATRVQLAKEIRASYMAGRQQRVKLMLNQEDPASLSRMLVYQGYFTRARTARMDTFKAALAQLQENEQLLIEQRASLAVLQDEQRSQTAALTEEQARQREVLAGLEQQLGDKARELETLQQDEQRLGKLVEKLRKALLDIPVGDLDKPLKSLKGKLNWPVPGRLARNYGEKLGVGNSRSRGMVIATYADTDVQAIAKGRVAFADWLRGFGLLMIIEHGDGYMSLYGRNNSLYKGVGEWVERGDVIAAAGNSGGQSSTALYLELRKNGQPIDPRSWFRGKPRSLKASR